MRCFLLLIVLVSLQVSAQTGPAGVGNASTNPLWLKATNGTSTTTNGVSISAWNDQSANGNNATQATAAKQPLFSTSIMNGQPAILFDNNSTNNDELSIPDVDNLDNTNGLTIFTVSRPTALDGSARGIISKRVDVGNNESYLMFYYTSNLMNVDIDGNGDRFVSATTFANSTNYLIDLLYDGTLPAASRAKLYVNSNLDVTKTAANAAIPNYSAPVTIGSLNIGDGRPFGGYIAEVIVYHKAVNAVERLIVDNYLSSKYNITLATGDAYAGDTPANGDYDFEVAGVGTDVSGSNSAASSSISGGFGISQVSGFQNGDLLLYGHTSTGNATNTSDIAGMTGANNARWQRIWNVDITNAGANEIVNMVFDMSDAGSTIIPTIASNYVLLYRLGQSGPWTEVATANSISGDQLLFNSVTVSVDGYYTLGTHDKINSPLPVQLTQFTGIQESDGVHLEWETASELNNSFFSVTKSADGASFISLANVNGAGTTTQKHLYHLLDTSPYPNLTYYRLTQTDLDGLMTAEKMIAVETQAKIYSVNIYPNPAKDMIHLQLNTDWSDPVVELYTVQQKSVAISPVISAQGISIDTSSIPRGLYIIKVSDYDHSVVSKIILE